MDHTDNQLRACVKSLNEVITPSLTPGDAQAAEQAFLVTDYLGYLRTRLDYLYDRHRFEVRHHLAMASAIVDDTEKVAPDAATGLRSAIKAGEDVLEQPGARVPTLRQAAAQLAGAITATLRAVASSPDDQRADLERRVVELSSDKIAVDRSWHLPQGLDGDPSSVLDLEEALGIT